MPGVGEEGRDIAGTDVLFRRSFGAPIDDRIHVLALGEFRQDLQRRLIEFVLLGAAGQVEQRLYGPDVPGGVIVQTGSQVAPRAQSDDDVDPLVVRGHELADAGAVRLPHEGDTAGLERVDLVGEHLRAVLPVP